MNRLNRILVPVDFSEASKGAMQYGARLALQFHARLIAAHIVPSFAAFTHAFPAEALAFERQLLAEAERRLPDEIPESYRTRLDTLFIVRGGDVRDEISNIVESENIDLVVMGTHGRRALERFFIGSTTEHLLHKVPVPILTISRVSEKDEPSSEASFRKVVYATDLSETADAGFRYCVDLVRGLGAQMTLLHILDVTDSVAFNTDLEVRTHLEERLHKMIEREDCIGLPMTSEVGQGIPYLRILKFAEETGADLLVINLQSSDLLEREFLGSTAERIIRSARIPVLSMPSPTARQSQRNTNAEDEASKEISGVKIA